MADFTKTSLGSCKPTNKITLLAFKLVQQQANRFLDANKETLLTCDGIIGKKTLAAVNSVGNMFPTTGILGAPAPNCESIANNPQEYAVGMKAVADNNSLALPECPKGLIRSITRPEPKVLANGSVSYPANSSLAHAGFAGIPLWLIALIGAGGYYAYQKKKGVKKPFGLY